MEDKKCTLTAHERIKLIAALSADLECETDHDRQIMQEMAGVEEGVNKFRSSLEEGSLKMADTPAGRRIFDEMMNQLIPAIRADQEFSIDGIANAGKGVRPVWWWYINFISPEKLAYITIRSIMAVRVSNDTAGRKATHICMEIGTAIKQQIEFEMWLKEGKRIADETGGSNLRARLVRTAKNFNQRQWGNWCRRIESIETLDWRRDVRIHIGAKLLELAIVNTGGFFELRYVHKRGKTERNVFLSDESRMMIEDINSRVEVMQPVLKPMLVPPRPWEWDEYNKRYTGGFLMTEVEFIRGGIHKHTASLKNPMSATTLNAADILGAVPWRVDEWSLDLAREVFINDLQLIPSMPSPDPIPIPERIDDAEWEKYSKVERAEHKYQLSKIHGQNARDVSKREAALRKFALADANRGVDLYHPIKADARTRFYYTTPDWNPQGDDLARGTMRFSNKQRIGEDGMKWLAVACCNNFGNDKIAFSEMEAWCQQNFDNLKSTVETPFENTWWSEADEPLQFLQAASEYVKAAGMDNPAMYESDLPVHQDGSNNGLQLMSLLGRDPIGAKLTNCSSLPVRYDIYSETASIVQELIGEDVMNGHRTEEAKHWVGHVTRSTCKRACMTTSYGVTPRGIRDQLISDGFVEELDGDRIKNASYLRDKLIVALERTVVASRPIMDYFQGCAAALAEFDYPLEWLTPAGSIVRMSYYNIAKSDVKTVMGSYFLWDENPRGGINVRKQTLASSPNVIHSLDAALMQRMVNTLHDLGVYDIGAIHDSFAVHPSNVSLMRDVIRQEACKMFSGDWIRDEFHPYVERISRKVSLPEPPEQGTFNVNEVLDAEYFFA